MPGINPNFSRFFTFVIFWDRDYRFKWKPPVLKPGIFILGMRDLRHKANSDITVPNIRI